MSKSTSLEMLEMCGLVVAGAAVAAAASSFAVLALGQGSVMGGMLAASFASAAIVGGPLAVKLVRANRELAERRRSATRAATYDPATLFLNRGAFGGTVERRVVATSAKGKRQGAFVIVDASELRTVNRKYGLAWGDEALRLIAGAIRANVRSDDIVGRIGADQFGIFLAGAGPNDVKDICERIREAVRAVYFAPGENRAELSVTFGGIVFDNELGFDAMFRHAAAQLDGNDDNEAVKLGIASSESAFH